MASKHFVHSVRHPLIFWPAFGTSVLKAEVSQQDSLPDCPASGTFYASFGNYPECDIQLLMIVALC